MRKHCDKERPERLRTGKLVCAWCAGESGYAYVHVEQPTVSGGDQSSCAISCAARSFVAATLEAIGTVIEAASASGPGFLARGRGPYGRQLVDGGVYADLGDGEGTQPRKT